ncbi:hypothetical protein ALC56_12028, partial [Trachymyrmex septentrionalis]
RVQALDRKGAVGKYRRISGSASLRPKAPNERSNGGRSGNLCSAKRTHESDVLLKGPNWISAPRGPTLTPAAPVRPYALTFGHGT